MKKVKVKINLEVSANFYSYGSKAKDARAVSQIRKHLLNVVKDNNFAPLYVEKDECGDLIEDCTQELKVKIKK